jgi:hypothetical protein
MSLQITILKVLAGLPEGRASLEDLKHYVAVLASSGADWTQRIKRLAARAPELDIFSSDYVRRDPAGWQITKSGHEFLVSIEEPSFKLPAAHVKSVPAELAVTPVASPPLLGSCPPNLPPNVIQLVDYKLQRRPRSAA